MMKNRIHYSLLCIVVFLLATNSLKGQSYYFRHYQVENGLSNNTVGCSLQDRQGFLWFGTKDGLNRFDGYTFKIFQNDRDDPKSLGSNFIISLHEDKSGTLWVGTDRGLFKYNATTESFSPVNVAPVNEIRGIQMDNNHDLWFIVKDRLFKYDLKKGTAAPYKPLKSYSVTSICLTTDGALWISVASGSIEKLNPVTNSVTGYDLFPESEPIASRRIQKVYDAGNGLLLAGTSNHGMKIFDTRTATYKDISLYDKDKTGIFVRDFIQYSANEYWIATESGLFIYNIKNGRLINLKKEYNNPYSLSDNAIYTFFRDKEGGIWTGTYFGGINYYPKQYTSFKKYFPEYGINSVSGNAIREICKDNDGNLWIGTEDAGLNKLNIATGHFTQFNPDKQKNKISHTNIHGLLINGNKLWAGTFHKGLDVLDLKTGKVIQHYTAAHDSLSSDFICCLLKTRAGKIIAATDRGLCYFNVQKNNFKKIKAIPQTFYTRVYEDKAGTIWAGSYSEGLYYFNPKTKSHGNFKYKRSDKSSISGNRINWIFEDSAGNLWVATEGGLCRLNKHEGNFTNYTTKDGLPSNIIYTVLEDAEKNFWISTSRGLVCFSPQTKKIITYTKINGLLSDQFNYNSAYKDPAGRLYFGSVKGLISFHPAEFLKNTFLPPVYITGFQVYDKELEVNKKGSPLKKSITYTDTITLQYNQSSLSIDFAALSFTAPEMTEYAYKLNGLDKNWTFLKTNRKAFFTELAPGTYVFNVKGSVGNNVWGKPAALTIKILPPFWKSNWAYVFYAVLVIDITCLMLSSYHQRHEEKNKRKLEILGFEKEKEVYQAKIDFFTNVAHEIRTPLTLIKGPLEKVIKRAAELPAIKDNLLIMERNTDRLVDLTSQLLDFRKTEVNGFSLNFVQADIAEILKDNYSGFKPVAEQKQINFEMQAPAHLFAYVDIEALNKILGNILNNAIKYANTKVFIRLLPHVKKDRSFTIEVRNDGHLIPYEMREKIFEAFFRLKDTEKQIGTGIGLALSRSLAELHKGTLELEKSTNDLNTFVLKLPISQKAELN